MPNTCRGRHSTYRSRVNNNISLTGNTIISSDAEASSELYEAFIFLQITYNFNPGFTDKSENMRENTFNETLFENTSNNNMSIKEKKKTSQLPQNTPFWMLIITTYEILLFNH